MSMPRWREIAWMDSIEDWKKIAEQKLCQWGLQKLIVQPGARYGSYS
jgi:hypothetical protein